MWPFSKKELPDVQEKKFQLRTKKLIYENQDLNVGVTRMRVTFSDGTTFDFKVYGSWSQRFGNDETMSFPMKEPYAEKPYIYNSLQVARQHYVLCPLNYSSFVDDAKEPMSTRVGTALKIDILSTDEFMEKGMIAKIVDAEEK